MGLQERKLNAEHMITPPHEVLPKNGVAFITKHDPTHHPWRAMLILRKRYKSCISTKDLGIKNKFLILPPKK